MLRQFIANVRTWALPAVWLAAREPRIAWFVKGLAMLDAAYAVSLVDLTPDVISVIGLPDNLIVVPLEIMLVVRLIPEAVMREHRETAAQATRRPVSRMTAGLFILMWVICAALLVRALLSFHPGAASI